MENQKNPKIRESGLEREKSQRLREREKGIKSLNKERRKRKIQTQICTKRQRKRGFEEKKGKEKKIDTNINTEKERLWKKKKKIFFCF